MPDICLFGCMKPNRDNETVNKENIRIFVVGDHMSGKSSLIKKFVYDAQPSHHSITVGINFEFKEVQKEGENIRLQIFDAGFHVYNDLVHNLISGYGIHYIIVCVDLTNPNSSHIIGEWETRLEEMDNFSECRIVVCGTKSDVANCAKKTSKYESMMAKSSKVVMYFETSSMTGLNIDDAFNFIVDFHWVKRLSRILPNEL